MLKFKSIRWKNFLSTGSQFTEVKLDRAPTTLIIGENGAGKSTISSLIPRLYDVTQGSILIDKQDIRNYTIKSLRKLIGVVTQDSHMFHDSILNNLKYANQINNQVCRFKSIIQRKKNILFLQV